MPKRIVFAAMLDHLAGRHDPAAAAQAGTPMADQALRLLNAGRRAAAAPQPSSRLLKRAMKIFREAQAGPRPSLLRLVLDSFAQPAAAVRDLATADRRFLRFEGETTIELQVAMKGKGLEVRGQIEPPDFASTITLRSPDRTRRAQVESDGTFLFRGVPPGMVEIAAGNARILHLEL